MTLAMKNPRSLKDLLAITSNYTLTEEATLDNREAKKDKELSQLDRPDTSKSNDNKRKHDWSMANVERPQCEYWPRLGEFEGFLDRICIFHPQGKHKTQDWNRLQGFTDEVLKSTKKVDQNKKLEDPKGYFPEAHK
jgi:hypothetical protein